MRWLGIDRGVWYCCEGQFDDYKKSFGQERHLPSNKLMGWLYFTLYKKKNVRNFLLASLLKAYSWHRTKKFLRETIKNIPSPDTIVLSGHGADSHLWKDISPLLKNISHSKTIVSDRIWAYINSVKFHPKFEYPSLVFLSTTTNTFLAYLPDETRIVPLIEGVASSGKEYKGLGVLTIDVWVRELKEEVSWPGQPQKGRKNVYALYKERGDRGKNVLNLKEDLAHSTDLFAEKIFTARFPEKMRALREKYASEEPYRDDWVASQQQLLRDFVALIKERELKSRQIKTFFLTGGLSMNPAFASLADWFRVSRELAGEEKGGNALAYLGYCIEKEGLRVEHDRWKDGR
jgi:hypothetical protein